MTIAIDGSRAIIEKAGIGRHTLNLVKKMIEIDKINKYVLFFSYFRSDPEKERIIRSFKSANVKIKVLKIPGILKEFLWRLKLSWFKAYLGEVDVFFAPSIFEINYGLKIPQVLTIYDLTTFIFPKHRGESVSNRLNLRTKEVSQIAKKIIVISKSTANDLTKYLKVEQKKIELVYPGLNQFKAISPLLAKPLKSRSYILTVGTIEPRKNLINLFKGYALLPPKLQEKYPLVVVGQKGWNNSEAFQVIQALRLNDKVKFFGFISDEVLGRLYKDAACFVYPSYYEGFGFPVLEALNFQLPVITSKVSSLPEVAGKAAYYIDPNNPRAISKGLQTVLEHQEEAKELKKLALTQAQKFSWEKAAKETIKVLEEAYRG